MAHQTPLRNIENTDDRKKENRTSPPEGKYRDAKRVLYDENHIQY